MTNIDMLVADEARSALQQLATGQDIDGRRAAALLAVADGHSQAEAAAAHDLTEGQVGYIVRKFREQGLAAFAPASDTDAAAPDEAEQLRQLVESLNARVAELEQMVQAKSGSESAAYSPLRLLTTVRDNVQKLTPEMQLDVLRNFQGMSAEDLLDLDTWKGLAYMMTYSARFQAEQVRGKVSGCLLYTSDAADERSSVDLGGRRIIKKKNKHYVRANTMILTHSRHRKHRRLQPR